MEIRIKTSDAIEFFGGRGRGGVITLARKLGITHGAISQWGEYVPDSSSYKLFVLTEGRITVSSGKAPAVA